MKPLPTTADGNCWNRIGVWGDGTCPELATAVHCHNCPVFAAAGKKFLEAAWPDNYSQEWAERLAIPIQEQGGHQETILVFCIGEEWLALPVRVLVEVIPVRTVLRAAMAPAFWRDSNIRGELQLCVRINKLLGIESTAKPDGGAIPRLLVIRQASEEWVFPVDEVDRVRKFSIADLANVVTLERASSKLTRGVFNSGEIDRIPRRRSAVPDTEGEIAMSDPGRLFDVPTLPRGGGLSDFAPRSTPA